MQMPARQDVDRVNLPQAGPPHTLHMPKAGLKCQHAQLLLEVNLSQGFGSRG